MLRSHAAILVEESQKGFREEDDIRELRQPRRRRQQEHHKFTHLTRKMIPLHALHAHFSCLENSKTFSFYPRPEMTCFAVEWTT